MKQIAISDVAMATLVEKGSYAPLREEQTALGEISNAEVCLLYSESNKEGVEVRAFWHGTELFFIDDSTEPTKVCGKCGKELPESDFARPYSRMCKKCAFEGRSEGQRRKGQKNRETNNPLSAYRSNELFAELARRGYTWDADAIKMQQSVLPSNKF